MSDPAILDSKLRAALDEIEHLRDELEYMTVELREERIECDFMRSLLDEFRKEPSQ